MSSTWSNALGLPGAPKRKQNHAQETTALSDSYICSTPTPTPTEPDERWFTEKEVGSKVFV